MCTDCVAEFSLHTITTIALIGIMFSPITIGSGSSWFLIKQDTKFSNSGRFLWTSFCDEVARFLSI
jgi:hypothetical protein